MNPVEPQAIDVRILRFEPKPVGGGKQRFWKAVLKCTGKATVNDLRSRAIMTQDETQEALNKLMRIHYEHFMANPRFWYEPYLQAADMLICIAASDIRLEMGQKPDEF